MNQALVIPGNNDSAIADADEFRKMFIGINPLHRLFQRKRYRTYDELAQLIMARHGFSEKEAQQNIEELLDRIACYYADSGRASCFSLRKEMGLNGRYYLQYLEQGISNS